MANYRDHLSALNRLKAYYKNNAEFNDIPFKLLSNSINIDMIEDEYGLNIVSLEGNNKLVITSRRLIVLQEKENEKVSSFDFDSISGIYLEFPYKKETPPHFLSILINNEKIVKLKFPDLERLVQARNEIHKVISIVLIDWKGADFVIEKTESIPNINVEIIP